MFAKFSALVLAAATIVSVSKAQAHASNAGQPAQLPVCEPNFELIFNSWLQAYVCEPVVKAGGSDDSGRP